MPTATALTVEDVWVEFGAGLRAFVGRRVADPHQAEDLVAEIVMKVHRRLDTLDDQERLTAWVFRIARNVIKDHYKVSGRRREVLDAELGDLPSATTTDEWVDDQDAVLAEMAVCLRPLLSELPADYRRALELTDLGGDEPGRSGRAGTCVAVGHEVEGAAGPTPARRSAAPVLHSHPRQPRRPPRLPAPPRHLPLTAHAQGSSA